MRTVGLKTLKNKLSEYVRVAAAGETVVITDRGRPVAEIVPPRRELPAGEGSPLSAFEQRGIREGWLIRSPTRAGCTPTSKPVEGLIYMPQMEDWCDAREDDWYYA